MTTTSQIRSLEDDAPTSRQSPAQIMGSVLDAIDCGIVVHGRGAEILAVNQKACELLGLSESQIRGRSSFDPRWNVVDESGNNMPPNLHPSVMAEETGEPVRDVVMGVFQPQIERRVWLLVSAVPELDVHDEVSRVVVTFVDISKRREAEADSRRDRALMEEVFRTVPAGIAVIDSEGRARRTNHAAERLLSLPAQRLEDGGRPRALPGRLTQPDGTPLAEHERPTQRVLDSQDGFVGARYMWVGPSGRRRIFSMNGARLRNPVSGDHQAVLTFHDITLQEATAQATRHAKRRLDAALRAADLGRIDIQVDTNTVSADGAWLKRHGLPGSWAESELDRWVRHLDPADLEHAQAQWQRHLNGDLPTYDASVWLTPPVGSRVRLQLTGQVDQRDASGRVSRLSGVLRDVTQEFEAREAAHRIEAQAAELARLEGTAAVAGGVAHTFSNLLGGVLGAVTSLEEQVPAGTSLADTLAVIRDASEQAGVLTTQLRGVSGHGRFRMVVTRLPQQARAMQGLLNTALSGRGQVEVLDVGTPPPVEVDTDQLRQVAVNLVLNAAEADARSCPLVVVQTRSLTVTPGMTLDGLATPEQPEAGEYALLEVIDQGCGMTAEVRRRMFEPFFSTQPGRAGLGLSAVLGIARGHKGFVTVRSAPGSGTTVTLALRASAEQVRQPHPPTPKTPDNTTFSTTAKVLVVDDEPVIRKLVQRVLVRAGFGVETVADGQFAIDTLVDRRDAFDLLLLDLTMPGMSGEEVLSLTQSRWPDLPVLVMSGYTESEVAGRLVGAGKVAFIPKPFTADQLRRRVDEMVRAPSQVRR